MEFCLLDPLVGAAAVGAKELVAVDALGAGHLVIVTAVAILTTSYPHKSGFDVLVMKVISLTYLILHFVHSSLSSSLTHFYSMSLIPMIYLT